ncbi:hypothetical protein EJ357_17625 [Streptomyces cyaneochromogenes]|uniref:Uncharacterized protein n=1 Tax=Streptomyces cyaneochromogenes TaxID=2496836 RepID=A0A3Q9ET95_9ACTN|nr:hypothetical protein [Streptomyces cyaneochromogenes]AZQ35089.1 hypothetical protein EJ357_17625 [Streptomyces cyaneochromogenes]
MSDLTIPLPPDVRRELDDLADATGRLPEDIALDAVLHQLVRESSPVAVTAELLAAAHADLLRRLGE